MNTSAVSDFAGLPLPSLLPKTSAFQNLFLPGLLCAPCRGQVFTGFRSVSTCGGFEINRQAAFPILDSDRRAESQGGLTDHYPRATWKRSHLSPKSDLLYPPPCHARVISSFQCLFSHTRFLSEVSHLMCVHSVLLIFIFKCLKKSCRCCQK